MSNVCLGRGKLDDADRFNKKAIVIFQQMNDAPKIDLAKSLNQSALISTANQRYNDAATSLKKVVNLFHQPSKTEEQTLVATALDNLGGVYLKMADYGQAEIARKQALSMFEKSAGPKSIETAKCLINLAAVWDDSLMLR